MAIFNSYVSLPEGKPNDNMGYPLENYEKIHHFLAG